MGAVNAGGLVVLPSLIRQQNHNSRLEQREGANKSCEIKGLAKDNKQRLDPKD